MALALLTAEPVGAFKLSRPNNLNLVQLSSQQSSVARHRSMFDEKSDGIATSSTDDMFAFSTIIAGGEKVSEVTKELEKDTVRD